MVEFELLVVAVVALVSAGIFRLIIGRAGPNPPPSDLGSVARLEPMNGRVIDVVGKRDLTRRLARSHSLQRLARLMLGELRPAAKPRALGMARIRPPLVRCRIRSRSKAAMPPSTVNINLLCGVVVSTQGSPSDLKGRLETAPNRGAQLRPSSSRHSREEGSNVAAI